MGRQYIYGAELAPIDGASFTFDRPGYTVTIFGGEDSPTSPIPISAPSAAPMLLSRSTPIPASSMKACGTYGAATKPFSGGTSILIGSLVRTCGPTEVRRWISARRVYTIRGTGRRSSTQFLPETQQQGLHVRLPDRGNRHGSAQPPAAPLFWVRRNRIPSSLIHARRTIFSIFRLGGSVWVRRLDSKKDEGALRYVVRRLSGINSQIFPVRGLRRRFSSTINAIRTGSAR